MISPTVSILVPTYNRRIFIPQLIRNYLKQDYDKERMELVLLDDGTDPIYDLLRAENIPNVTYMKLDNKASLGTKRNKLAEISSGEILVHMDDDDIYTSKRVSHAVDKLIQTDNLLVGSSLMYVYDAMDSQMYQSGLVSKYHCIDPSLAYKREYLKDNKYADVTIGPESSFTKNFTNPMVHLDPMHSAVCVRHRFNTYPKRTRIPAKVSINDFITSEIELEFYKEKIKYL